MSQRACAIALLGPPASGKTTLARSLATRGGLSIIEVGALLSREVERGTSLGQALRPYIATGALAPLDLVMGVISNALEATDGKVILFDGIPRSLGQIEPFLQMLAAHSLDLCAIIVLALDLETAIDRISRRLICSQCGAPSNLDPHSNSPPTFCKDCGGQLVHRVDDREEVVRQRFKSYERESRPVIEFFQKNFGARTSEHSAVLPAQQQTDHVWHFLQSMVPGTAQERTDSPAHTP